jgi:hypothetical protein
VVTSRAGTTAFGRPGVRLVVKSLILCDTERLLGHLINVNGSSLETFRA